ncbi:hypothetical protein C2S51_003455 [Perilla frutescens var. frutescens]|nr:hypothetical protein C2S51_003455 [Perilla frutescens var. frutescens]
MANAAVDWLLENLQHLLLHEAHLIRDAKTQLEKLEMDLRLLKAFLTASTTKRRKEDDGVRQELLRQARDVIYEAEDVIDAFVFLAGESRSKNCFVRAFRKPVKLISFSKQIENVSAKVRNISSKEGVFDFSQPQGSNEEIIKVPMLREDNVVGFEDEKDVLIKYLTEETKKLDVITIVGMPGIGKTTLAWQIYRDPIIQYEFPTLIWIHVSNNFTYRDVYLAIWKKFTGADATGKSDEELAQQICFLYFGMFPPHFEIPVGKLISMWIAEGFIRQRDGLSMEETAENYLNDLINRQLVEVDQIKSNGKVKTCRIHRMLHDFCKIQAGEEMENNPVEVAKEIREDTCMEIFSTNLVHYL